MSNSDAFTHIHRMFLVRPGDTLVFGNVGPVELDTDALEQMREQLGLAAVFVFAENIDMAVLEAAEGGQAE